MNTKYLMMSSAIVTGFLGLTASFLPAEILTIMGSDTNQLPALFVQITGALYLGFAGMNWMARNILIGGIYSKPLGMGNCLHFTIAALAIFKFATVHSFFYIWAAAIVYAIFAILFCFVVFTSPKQVVANRV